MSKSWDKIKFFFENIKQIRVDKENRKKFVIEIQDEIDNVNSLFNRLGLSIDNDKEVISCMLTVPENYQTAGTDQMIYNKLKEESLPINRYISQDLNWGEYFTAPSFFHIEDEDPDTVSCTYLATWEYVPLVEKYDHFKRDLCIFAGINGTLAIGLIAALLIIIL